MAGRDKLVVLWSIQDHISSLAADPGPAKSPGSGGSGLKNTSKVGGSNDKPIDSPTIGPRGTYQGHENTVEDVQFCPSRYVSLLKSNASLIAFRIMTHVEIGTSMFFQSYYTSHSSI